MLELTTDTKLILAGTVIGLAFGAILQRTHFCTMGCLADFFLFGSKRRLRVWALAIAVAILGTQALQHLAVVPIEATVWASPGLAWGPTAIGGLLFGFGMVLAGGCASRNLGRLASGSLKALVVLLTMASVAVATSVGILAPLRLSLLQPLVLAVGDSTLPALVGKWSGLEPGQLRPWIALAVALPLSMFSLADREFRADRAGLATGLGLGALVPLAWLATGWWAGDELEPRAPQALSFVGPTAQLFTGFLLASISDPFGPSLMLSTLGGAFLTAAAQRSLRLEGFTVVDDLVRHLVGGALMGFGGVTAMGCTVGQGISGISTLSAGAFLALAGMAAGAAWALRFLQRGHLWR